MQVFLVSDHEELGARVRRALLRQGQDCPSANVVSLNLAPTRLTLARPDLIIVALSPDPERALQVITELRAATPARILAVGPASDPKLIRRSYQMGVGEYIDEIDLEPELISALERHHTDAGTQSENARTIAVLGPSGGCGSSTIAVNIATKLAKDHKKALLVDLKLEAGDLASLLDLRPTHTLADLCQSVDRLDRSMFERTLATHESGVHLLAPPRNIVDIRYVTAEGVRQALTLARSLYPYVVIDLDHSFRDEQVESLRQSDLVLLVLRLDFTALRNTQRTLDYLGHNGISGERVRLVVNRHGQPKEVPAAKAEEALGIKISHYIPDEPKTVNRANNNGVPVILEAPSAKVSRSLTQLAVSVNGRHSK